MNQFTLLSIEVPGFGGILVAMHGNQELAVVVWLLSERGSPLVVPANYFSLYGSMSDGEAQECIDRLIELGILEGRGTDQDDVSYSLSSKGRDIAKAFHQSRHTRAER